MVYSKIISQYSIQIMFLFLSHIHQCVGYSSLFSQNLEWVIRVILSGKCSFLLSWLTSIIHLENFSGVSLTPKNVESMKKLSKLPYLVMVYSLDSTILYNSSVKLTHSQLLAYLKRTHTKHPIAGTRNKAIYGQKNTCCILVCLNML